MPRTIDDEIIRILRDYKNIEVLTISNEQIEMAEKESNEYLKNKILSPNIKALTIYYIIKKLPLKEQVNFIVKNIEHIKKLENEIFLYNSFEPRPLATYLSYETFKEIYKISKQLAKNILNNNFSDLVSNFQHYEYIQLYKLCYKEIYNFKNYDFINRLDNHNTLLYKDRSIFELAEPKDFFDRHNIQKKYNKNFMKYIIKEYSSKVNGFNYKELLSFINKIEDIDLYKKYLQDNQEKLKIIFSSLDDYNLSSLMKEVDYEKQQILIELFFETIIENRKISTIIYSLSPEIIISLYKTKKYLFKDVTLENYIEVFNYKNIFNDDVKTIIDEFTIDNIEIFSKPERFNTLLYSRKNLKLFTYIENKYRNSLKNTQELKLLSENTTIFSIIYLNNLTHLKFLLKTKQITRENNNYKIHLDKFIDYLLKNKIILPTEQNHYSIEILFYRIVMGANLTSLYNTKNLKDIILLNRVGKIEFNTNDFTINQIENYNIKNHRKLYEKYKENALLEYYKIYTLKLMLLIGERHTKNLLEINDSINMLEHLVETIELEKITVNKNGEPNLNKKIINLLFDDKKYTKIKNMFNNLNNDLYKYFPRIFNEWYGIVANNRHKSLASIIDFLKATDLALPPKYYRLTDEFKYIGCSTKKVIETLKLHAKVLERTYSTIPKINGTYNEYDYEILDLHDMTALSVGSKTSCCFTILGVGYSCLKHAVTSINGRILVVRKNNELIAHSWVWRNGNLLCLDNIETSKNINKIDFLDLYLKFADEIIKYSFIHEGEKECLKNITIGLNCKDNNIEKLEKFPCILSKNIFTTKYQNSYTKEKNNPQKLILDNLPQPLEEISYSDSKNCQYLIKNFGIPQFYQSSYYYRDNRNKVLHYEKTKDYSDSYLELIEKKLNALIYTKYEEEGNLNNYKYINITDMKEVYCNDDWFFITKKDDTTLDYIKSSDKRSIEETKKVLKSKSKKRIITKVN